MEPNKTNINYYKFSSNLHIKYKTHITKEFNVYFPLLLLNIIINQILSNLRIL